MSSSSNSSTATVILNGTTTHVGGEFVERIEINELPTGTILQLQHNSDNLSNVQCVTTTGGAVYATTADNFQIEGPFESEGVSGNTYVFNEETGELQLIDFSNVTTIEGEEVEIVSVDSKDILFGGFQSGLQFVDDGSFHDAEVTPSSTEVSSDAAPAPPVVSRTQVPPSPSSSCLTLSRPKNQPALLRNSRKIVRPSSSSQASSTLGGRTLDLPKTKSVKSTKSKSPGKQIILLEGQHARVIQDNSNAVALNNSCDHLPTGFYTYQNVPAEQVTTELVTSLDLNQIGSNVIFLTDPPSGEGSSSSVQTPTQSVIVRNSQIASSKSESSKKKRPKKVTIKPEKEAVAPKKKTSGGGSRGGGTLEARCLEEGCGVVAHNVNELRKHLTEVHDLLFDLEQKEFSSDAVFKEWRQQYEKDRMVSFIYRGGTKKISLLQSVTYMICHRSGHYKPTMKDTATRKRKMKPQGSCKIGGYCTAGIRLVRNLEDGEILADICHTHYGHPLDSEALPHLRVNPVLKKMLVKKFEEGMTFAEMLAYIHHNPDGLEGLRVVDRRAIRNMFETWRKSKEDNSKLGLPSSQTTAENTEKLARVENSHLTTKKLKLSMSEGEQQTSKDSNQPIADEHRLSEMLDPPLVIPINSVKSLKKTEEQLPNQKTDHFGGRGTRSSKDKLVVLKSSSGKKASEKMAFTKIASLKGNMTKAKSKLFWKKPHTRSSTTAANKFSLENEESQREQPTASEDNILEHFDDDSYQIQISPELEASIDKLNNHGEAGPTILMYKKMGSINVKYGGFCRAFKEDDFCLIVQTPVQRQIFQLFPKIVSFEILEGPKTTTTTSAINDSCLKLAFISVLDDFREAIPVAWMIADAICPRYLNQFCRMLRYHCGELPVLYLMAPRNTEILKSWSAHFSHKPKILQSSHLAQRDLRTLLCRHFPNDNLRIKIWTAVENLINEKSVKKVKTHKDELFKLTHHGVNADNGKIYWRKMEKDWLSKIEEWSFAYRVGIQANLLFAEESFFKLRRFITFKGTKHLNQCIDQILKIGYDKCFLRAKRMFKGDQKLSRIIERLDTCHEKAVTSLCQVDIENVEEFKWKLEGEGGEVVKVFHLRSPCDCKLKCKLCKICMHEYMCTCDEFVKVQTMCAHIHKVHCMMNGYPLESPEKKENCKGNIVSNPGIETAGDKKVIRKKVEESSNNEAVEVVSSLPSLEAAGSELEEITIINESDLEHLNISEVLGLLGGSLSNIHSQQDAGGGLHAQIVSITDIDTQKVIYSLGSTSPLAIFQLDPE